MRREEQKSAMDGLTEANDAPIDLTKKTEPTPKPINHSEISENKTSPEWQMPPFYPPVFFLGGEPAFRGFPAVAMANPFLLPYYPLLYEQLSLRYAMMRANPAYEGVLSNHCLYRAASDTYLKDHVQQSKARGMYYGDNSCRRNHSNLSQVDDQSILENGHNTLRKCKSLGALSSRVTQEDALSNHSSSCPDIQLSLNYSQRELERPRGKRIKMDLPFSMMKNHSREDKMNHSRQNIFDLSAESRSQSMPSVSQGEQETFLQKLRHVAPAGYPCNVYGYYTQLMQKYQDHEELKRRVGIEVEQSPPSSPGPEANKKRPTRTLTGKHVRHGTGASPSTLLTLRQMIQKRQQAKELGQTNGIGTKCKAPRKHSTKNSRRST